MLTQSIDTVIYHFPIGDYNVMCYEDSSTDRAREAFKLFEILIQRGFFTNKHLIITFTKYDIFLEKIKKVPITVSFNEFPVDSSNPNDPDHVVDFCFKRLKDFLVQNNVDLIAPVKLYCINATDVGETFQDFLDDLSCEIFDVTAHPTS